MRAMYTFLIILVWPFFNLFHPCRPIGRERIPTGGALLCGNHSSLCDPLLAAYAFGRKNQLRFMAKAEVLRIPVVGWLLGKAGVFGVERGKSDITAIKQALRFLKEGEYVFLFPEGTRVRDGKDHNGNPGAAKTGAAMLAVRTGVPIVPVYIPERKHWFRRTPVVFGTPYFPVTAEKKGTAEEYETITQDLMARVRALAEQAV
ncbi:MAG: lysophospholipid acyltransferase family protein [Pseudoflavonifractor sp.]